MALSFFREDLEASGAIYADLPAEPRYGDATDPGVKTAKRIDLNVYSIVDSYSMHPIFYRERWLRPQTSDAVYYRLIPALQLASMFITHEFYLDWWCTTCLSKSPEGASKSFKPTVLSHMPPTRGKLQKTRDRLSLHQDFVEFSWASMNDASAMTGFCSIGRQRKSLIFMNSKYCDFLERDDFWELDPSDILRFQFSFAIVLVHELAHSVRVHHHSGDMPGPESFHSSSEPANELGLSWEHYTFGGLVRPIDDDVTAVDGFIFVKWMPEERHHEAELKREELWTAVHMNTLRDYFSAEWWSRVGDIEDGKRHVQLTTVKSMTNITDKHPLYHEFFEHISERAR